jgi:hypothetical protein
MSSKNTKVNSVVKADTKKNSVKQSKTVVKNVVEDTDSEHSDSEPEVKPKTKATVKKVASADNSDNEASDSESEDHDVQDASESESESDSSDEDAKQADKNKKKDKKTKESSDDLFKELGGLQENKKKIEKDISRLSDEIKTKEKELKLNDRQISNILKLLPKSHSDEVNKARKEKPKRKGNVNGGFNKESPVPAVLAKFLDLEAGVCMARPKVMSALNNKLSELNLKEGQNTTLDKATCKALCVDKKIAKDLDIYDDASDKIVIKFGKFQTFLAWFYKEEKKEQE